ncbi:ABC transporter ATP-binding protein [Arthrobacter bambusae]|uniref:ABC-type dipeptide/oligopeptide/nickel transport system ATPase component n=1 Tax=Arthrobacter bambusae TaxID=1338426 RepID=A0AAW8DL28_9MICC|nr:ABC transporter ATP-binding protein [Arthrobacter bambusae]MDP9907212.1 ABC-type dipeptide/oligopeptide/nickel transport system ATPase component [Arthrobacter bambusae]MDQ0131301.1 ABC-type dipeptide/oligopeptide/nickel transport system ATPase component [Arthrobacter bambusae]MDQ0182634.1 ABC-type dipeptide/oligopeptide/nickel transport system ATPase component [Arthrobacter bambusae]
MNKTLQVRELETEFHTPRGVVRALHGVSFEVQDNEIVGIVGESGSGKSTVVRSITKLLMPPGKVSAGNVNFAGRNLLDLTEREMRQIRGKEIGFIAQNPFSALNPVTRIEKQFANIAKAHGVKVDASERSRALQLLESTGVRDPERVMRGYAHELSGGMAQRVVIAMALYLNPQLVIADEPTTALDLTVQRQVLDTLRRLTVESGRSMLIVTHDLGVVASYCNRVLVMYRGNIVEQGLVEDVFVRPRHPYTISLLNSVVRPEDETQFVPGDAEAPDTAEPEAPNPSTVQLSEARRS